MRRSEGRLGGGLSSVLTKNIFHFLFRSLPPLAPRTFAHNLRGFLCLPFVTLAMEKSIYDTTQAWQGIEPTVVPADRGGFPSGGGAALPSFALLPVDPVKKKRRELRLAGAEAEDTAAVSSS